MSTQKKLVKDCTIEELEKELIARGEYQRLARKRLKLLENKEFFKEDDHIARAKEICNIAPGNGDEALSDVDTRDMCQEIYQRSVFQKGLMGIDDRKDWYEIDDENFKRNASSVVGICTEGDLNPTDNGYSILRVMPYSVAYVLWDCERYASQPVVRSLFSGFLVTKDVVATAGHAITILSEREVKGLRFVFGFNMIHFYKPVIQIPDENIYRGDCVIDEKYDRNEQLDWALVKLDREVIGQEIAVLSENRIDDQQPVYAIGHPRGLPLKYSPAAKVCDNSHDHFFRASLDVFQNNSGSPVFNFDTHQVEGMVVHAEKDFLHRSQSGRTRGDTDGAALPDDCMKGGKKVGPKCTRVSEFKKIVDELKKKG